MDFSQSSKFLDVCGSVHYEIQVNAQTWLIKEKLRFRIFNFWNFKKILFVALKDNQE